MTAAQRRGIPPVRVLGVADRARLAALTRGLKALARPRGEQSLTVEAYDRLSKVIRRLAAPRSPELVARHPRR